jgi:hypothetical protein
MTERFEPRGRRVGRRRRTVSPIMQHAPAKFLPCRQKITLKSFLSVSIPVMMDTEISLKKFDFQEKFSFPQAH